MRLRVLCLLVGTVSLAGCSTQAASNPTSSPATVPPATAGGSLPTQQPTTAGQPTAPVVASGDAYRTGLTLLRRRQFSAAAAQFRRAIAANGKSAKAYASLAAALGGEGNFKASLAAYRKAHAIAPANRNYLYGAASAALYASQYHDTVTYTTALLNKDPKNVAAYHLQMLAYGRLYMPKGALFDAKHVVALEPKNPDAYDDLGIALANTRQYPLALQAFTRAIDLAPRYNYYSNRAVVENLLKQKPRAIADFKRAEALAPTASEKKLMATTVAGLAKSK